MTATATAQNITARRRQAVEDVYRKLLNQLVEGESLTTEDEEALHQARIDMGFSLDDLDRHITARQKRIADAELGQEILSLPRLQAELKRDRRKLNQDVLQANAEIDRRLDELRKQLVAELEPPIRELEAKVEAQQYEVKELLEKRQRLQSTGLPPAHEQRATAELQRKLQATVPEMRELRANAIARLNGLTPHAGGGADDEFQKATEANWDSFRPVLLRRIAAWKEYHAAMAKAQGGPDWREMPFE